MSSVLKLLIVVVSITLLLLLGLFLYSLLQTHRAEASHPPAGTFVEIDGVRLHYRDTHGSDNVGESDDRPVIVLIHGASTSSLDFDSSLRTPLSADFRVISFDRPGHGYSERGEPTHEIPKGHVSPHPAYAGWVNPAQQAELIAKALQQLEVDSAIWLGHSWAGAVIMAALLDQSSNIRAGIHLAGASHPWEGDSDWHVELGARPWLGPLFSHTLVSLGGRLSLESAIGNVLAPDPVPSNYIEDTGIHLSLRPRAFLSNAQDIDRLSDYLAVQSERYTEVSTPLLLITGSEDTIVPAWNHADRLVKVIPHARHSVLQGAGHAPHHTRTGDVVEAIRAFLDLP